jgi:hypothetical protein
MDKDNTNFDELEVRFVRFKYFLEKIKAYVIEIDEIFQPSELTYGGGEEYDYFKALKFRIDDIVTATLSNVYHHELPELASGGFIDEIISLYDSSLDLDFDNDKVSSLKRKSNDLGSASNNIARLLNKMMDLAGVHKTDFIKRVFDEVDEFENLKVNADRIRAKVNDATKKLDQINNRLSENEVQMSEADEKLRSSFSIFQSEFENNLIILKEKIVHIDKLIGEASKRVLASEYSKSAADEKRLADNFRMASIVFIVVITALFIKVLFETASYGIQIESSLVKVILGVLLGIPAAFFAKESNKHRLRQNALHQVSLELNTISPFLEDLPLEEKIKIKTNFANKIFGSSRQEAIEQDNIPTNVIELITEIVKKTGPK